MTARDESRGPSSWAHRGPLLALGCGGFFIATYLAVHQAEGTLGAVWEPLFGRGSERILGSSVARFLPVPDAAVGALGYAAEVVAGSMGGTDRWRTSPWSVLVFVAIALAMGIGSVGLLVAQPLVFHAFCTLCLVSAAISIALALGAVDEGRAALRTVRAVGVGRATGDGRATELGMCFGTSERTTNEAGEAMNTTNATKATATEPTSDGTSTGRSDR